MPEAEQMQKSVKYLPLNRSIASILRSNFAPNSECFDLTSDDRPEPWLRNAYDAMLHRMNSVIIHILLLFIQPDDGKIQTDIAYSIKQ